MNDKTQLIPHRKLQTAVGIIALALMVVLVYLIWTGYRETIDAAEAKTSGYAAILEARLDATLRRADSNLQHLALVTPLAALTQDAVPRYAREIEADLAAHLFDFPEVSALRIFDAEGKELYASPSIAGRRADISDRDHFRALRDNPAALMFSEVLFARSSGKPSVVMSRARRDERGAFRGVVTALIELEYFQTLFQTLTIGAGGNIAVYRSDDFTQVVRWPVIKGKLNTALPPDSPTRAALAGGVRKATVTLTSAADGMVRIYSYHTLQSYPFFISVGVARDEALTGWRQRSLLAGLSALALMGLLFALLRRLARADTARARLADIVENSNEAIISRSLDGTILTWNPGAEKMFGYSAAEAIGQPLTFTRPPGHRSQRIENNQRVLKGDAFNNEFERMTRDGRVITVSTSYAPIKDNAGNVTGVSLIMQDVTARKRAEEQTRALLDGIPDRVWLKDVQGRYLAINRSEEEAHGLPAAQIIGKNALEFRPAHQAQGVNEEDRAAMASAAPLRFERRANLGDSWCEIIKAPIRTSQGVVTGMVGISRDVTARKQAEAERARLASIVENSNEAIYSRTLDGTILTWNAGAERMFGYSASEVLGKPVSITLPPGQATKLASSNERMLRGELAQREFQRVTRDGRVIDVLASVSPTRDSNGNITGAAVILQDITALKQAQAAIKEIEERTRGIVASAMDAIVSVDSQQRVVLFNAAAEQLFGWREQDVIGQPLDRFIPERLRTRHHQHIETFSKTSVSTRGMGALAPVTGLHASGREFPVEASISQTGAGDQKLYTVIMRDISERIKAEEARASLEAQLRESHKMQAIGTLAGGIAHDFNNIIAIILNNVTLARQDASQIPHALVCLERIQLAGVRARDLVRQILAFSRRQPTTRKPINLIPVVEETTRLLRATLPVRLEFEVHCEPGIALVLADATQIQQALINLATNAMQAMSSGPGRIAIRLDHAVIDSTLLERHPALRELQARQPAHGALNAGQPRMVRIRVIDSGPGISEAIRQRIFEPFFTTKPAGEGTGLGLSVVHGIMAGHEGAITVDSQEGQGATFTLYLPPIEGKTQASADGTGMPTPAPSTAGARILCIDDEADLLFPMKLLLERRGYRVSAFTDARQALTALRADPAAFDLVLTDYNMPGLSGLDVAREVKSIRPDLPLVVISGFIDETLHTAAAAAGVRELMAKADSVDIFCDAVQRLLSERRS